MAAWVKTVLRVAGALVLFLFVFGGGAVTGYLYRGRDSASEYQRYRALVETYSRIAARAGKLEIDLLAAEKQLAGIIGVVGELRAKIDEIARTIDSGAAGVDRATKRLDEIEQAIRGLQGGSKP